MEQGVGVSAFDLNVGGMDPAYVRAILEAEKPRVLGISAQTETYLSGLRIAALAKEVDPHVAVVMGGPHPSARLREVAAEEHVDFVVSGEGETTMLELTEALLSGGRRFEEIRGIGCKQEGGVCVTPERPVIGDVDALPFPRRDLFPLGLYQHPGTVLTSRGGCPYNCSFCAVNTIWRGRRRFRSPERVAEEVGVLLNDLGLERVTLADDAFTLDRNHALAVCERFKRVEAPWPWEWDCSTRADLVDEEVIAAMREAGCRGVQFGAETGSQEILDTIGKRIQLEDVRRAVAMARGAGLDVLCSFMFPHPMDTEETIRLQARFMIEIVEMGAKIGLSFTTPYPGTRYFEEARALGITILAEDWDDFDAKHLVMETANLSREKLHALFKELVREVGLTGFSAPVPAARKTAGVCGDRR